MNRASAIVSFYRIQNGQYQEMSSYYHPSNGQFSGVGMEVAKFARDIEFNMHTNMEYDDSCAIPINASNTASEYWKTFSAKYTDMKSKTDEVAPYIYNIVIDEIECTVTVAVKNLNIRFNGTPEDAEYFLYECNN